MTHWCRVVMDESVARLVRETSPEKRDALEISGSAWSSFGFKTYASVHYPEFDICRLDKNYLNSFDIILLEQVLEHVEDPETAVQNIFSMLRPGGVVSTTTPFLIKNHGYPHDYSRWTAEGLSNLLQRGKFINVVTNSWGNRDCVIANFDSWVDYVPEHHSLVNDPSFPIVVWGMGVKP